MKIIKRATSLVLLSCAAFAAPSIAQETLNDTDQRLLACDQLADREARLACFNEVVESLRPTATEGPPSPVDPVEEVLVEEVPDRPAVEVPPEVEVEAVVEERPAAPDADVAVAVEAEAAISAAAPAAAVNEVPRAEPAAAASPAPAVRQVPAPRAAVEERATSDDGSGGAVIVRVWERHDGRFTVKLDNGQYWRETEGTRVGIPDVGDTVTISRGVFGSYRMKIDGIRRIAWVRQTE